MSHATFLKIFFFMAILIALGLSFSERDPVPDWQNGELVVIVPPADSVDYQFSYQLAERFASQLGVKLKTIALYPYQISNALLQGRAHLSAVGMRSNERDFRFKFGLPYQVVKESVVCGGVQPKKIEDLYKRDIVVIRGSSQEAVLNLEHQSKPDLHWSSVSTSKPSKLLEDVSKGDVDCVVANEEQISFIRNFFPGMEAAIDIGTPTQLAWTFATDVDAQLYAQMERFFIRIESDGTLDQLLDRYYGHTDRLVAFDAAAFLTKVNTVLPHYRQMFEDAAAITGVDWKLLAAVAYRESHWDPLATSYTKVRGMMMLTEDTADRMNVKNRLDARESIMAGARYLQLLNEQLPLRIDEPERTWFALAAYNQGMGHLEDARILAQREGVNPDVWLDVQKMMLKLRNPHIANTLKHGYARGGEAVIFVETVRLYYDMLKRLPEDDYSKLLLPNFQNQLKAW